MKRVFQSMKNAIALQQNTVLVTIVEKSGSVPRGAGASMLVGEDGLISGTIGGGALEGKSVELAKKILGSRESFIHTFYLNNGEDAEIQMYCGGEATVYFQFVDAMNGQWIQFLNELERYEIAGENGLIVRKIDGSIPFISNLNEDIAEYSDGYFLMPYIQKERVYIFGAGHCSKALAPVLNTVGFEVMVVDDREGLLQKNRFPEAKTLICTGYETFLDQIILGEDDYAVVMTDGHQHDLEVEARLLDKNLAYLGVMGSKRKTAHINEKLLKMGFSQKLIDTVHAPIGVKIGSVTPEEIAISITAEIISVRSEQRKKKGLTSSYCPA